MTNEQQVMRLGILRMDRETLASLLQLPAGAKVTCVREPIDDPSVIEMRIAGVGSEYRRGQIIPPLVPTIISCESGHRIVWPVEDAAKK